MNPGLSGNRARALFKSKTNTELFENLCHVEIEEVGKRERERERERETEKHQSVASHICPNQGSNSQPRHVP